MTGFDPSMGIPEEVRRRLAAMTPEQRQADVEASIARQRAADYAQLAAERGALAQRAAERRGVSHQLPKIYRGARWPDVPASCPAHEHVLRRVQQFVSVFDEREGLSAMFVGLKGTGKTKLACAVANELSDRGKTVAYTKAMTIFNRIKDGFGGRGETEEGVMHSLALADLLIVDEVGLGHATDAERTWLLNVIDRRYSDGTSMLFISNLEGAALRSALTEYGEERLEERTRGHLWLRFTWPSFRTQAARGARS
jgi:DNA replication protein DnaC